MSSEQAEMDRLAARVAELVKDDEEDYIPTQTTQRPGAITPLGVRVDKGQGLLSTAGASAVLSEMDAVLGGLKQWQQKHNRDMAELQARHKQMLEEEEAYQHHSAASDQEEEEEDSTSADEGTPDDDDIASAVVSHQNGGIQASELGAPTPTTPHIQPGASTHVAGGTGRGSVHYCAETASTSGSGWQGVASSRPSSSRPPSAGAPSASGSGGSAVLSRRMVGANGGARSRPASASAGRPPLDAMDLAPPLSSLKGWGALPAAPGGPSASASTPVAAPAGDASAAAVLRGQQLIEQLEAELRELDAAAEAPGSLNSWYAEVEGTLARLDTLQTGYQASSLLAPEPGEGKEGS